MPNSESRRSELKKLSDAASDGEWGVFDDCGVLEIGHAEKLGTRPCIVGWSGFDSTDKPMLECRANARLIVALVNAFRAGELVFSETAKQDSIDAARWREHCKIQKEATLPDALHIRLTMHENGKVWGSQYVLDVAKFGRDTILGIKAIGLSAEAQATKLFEAMRAGGERPDERK